MKTILPVFYFLCCLFNSYGQSFEETIQIDHSFSSPEKAVLVILNISGDLNIQESDGNILTGGIQHIVTAQDQILLEKGKQEIELKKELKGDTLFYYLKTPCHKSLKYSAKHEWSYDWSDKCNWDEEYTYRYNFDLQVPKGIGLILSTINNGDILVNKVSGPLSARNINGSIELKNVSSSSAVASTINGDVMVQFHENPIDSCRFYTLNGDINTYFQDGLSGQAKFKSFNGDFFTDLDQVETMHQLKPIQTKNEQGVKYRVNDSFVIRIGDGRDGIFLDFETFNGDAYLRTKKNP